MAEGTLNPTPQGGTEPTTAPEPKVTKPIPQGKSTEDAVKEAVEAAKAEWEKDNAKKLEDAKSEGARLAKLTAEQRRAEEDKLERKAIEKEKAEIAKERLTMYAETELTKAKLPTDIAELIAIESRENTKKIIDALKKTVDEGIQAGVTERLKGKTPPLGSFQPTEPGSFMDVIRENQR